MSTTTLPQNTMSRSREHMFDGLFATEKLAICLSLLWEGGQVAIWGTSQTSHNGLFTIRSEILLSDILENCRFACGSYSHPIPRLRAPVKLFFCLWELSIEFAKFEEIINSVLGFAPSKRSPNRAAKARIMAAKGCVWLVEIKED